MPRRALALAAGIGLLFGIAVPAAARNVNADNLYGLHILQSDQGNPPDTDLVNGWGIVASSTSPWWVSDNGTSKSTLYNGNTGAKLGLVVNVPGPPTGVVFNGNANDFKVDAGTGLIAGRFIFATDDGQIAAWNGVGTNAISVEPPSDDIYLGLAIADNGAGQHLYVANFNHNEVEVLDRTFQEVDLSGDFTDPGLPARYSPFNVMAINGSIFVAYAKQDAAGDEELHGEGLGVVDQYDLNGNFLARVATFGDLNAPWGMAMAPAMSETVNFGKFSGDLLVGNFGDGRIHAFRATADGWEAVGVIKGTNHRPITVDGLWGIGFGNGAASGPKDTLFFAAGPDDETHGLFGSITPPTQ
jgi:uncharacterized protein (TIGR03118 family)